MKNILILDNDWTLSKFKKWNFKNTIWDDLKINIRDYITDILWLNEKQYYDLLELINVEWYQLSEWFEKKCWIDRKKYFYETWKNLFPENYLIDRNSIIFRNIIENKNYFNIILTWAPYVWFEKTMDYLDYNLELFDNIYTAEDFYIKKDIILKIFQKKSLEIIKKSIAIWDEVNDYIHLQKLWWIGIDINNSILK